MLKFLATIIKWTFLSVAVLTGIFIYQMSEENSNKKESSINLIERAKKDSTLALKAAPSEIWSLYKQNIFAGDEKYKDKLINIQGEVKNIDAVFSTPVIELDAATNIVNLYATVYLHFDGDKKILNSILSKIGRGQKVRLLCYGNGDSRLTCYKNSFY